MVGKEFMPSFRSAPGSPSLPVVDYWPTNFFVSASSLYNCIANNSINFVEWFFHIVSERLDDEEVAER